MSDLSTTRILQGCLDRLRAGDAQARDELISHCCQRFTVLTRRMLGRYPRLRTWEETDDVAQNALLRLRRSLEQVQPATVRELFGLATVQVRRELMDLTRHYFGRKQAGDDNEPPRPVVMPLGGGRGGEGTTNDAPGIDPAASVIDASEAELWYKFHECVQSMPDNEREVVELLWYQELTQEEAAELISVDRSTVKRRWRAARERLYDVLKGWLPDGP